MGTCWISGVLGCCAHRFHPLGGAVRKFPGRGNLDLRRGTFFRPLCLPMPSPLCFRHLARDQQHTSHYPPPFRNPVVHAYPESISINSCAVPLHLPSQELVHLIPLCRMAPILTTWLQRAEPGLFLQSDLDRSCSWWIMWLSIAFC